MRWLLLPIFLIRLLIVVSPTFIELALKSFSGYTFVGALVIASWQFGLLGWSAWLKPTPPPQIPLPHHTPLFNHLKQHLPVTLITSDELTLQRAYWEELYQLQPTHRDILINVALLELYRDNQLGFETYWQQAQRVDPNHPVFQEELTQL